MPEFLWTDENNEAHEYWAPTVGEAVHEIYAETGQYPVDIWDNTDIGYEDYPEDEFYDENWGYGGTD